MERKSGVDLHIEPSEGGLKELVLRWFTNTQAPLILNNGNYPDWFQGFAARKDAEDLLRDKALGCFLIRLSDKAIAYILSYKGHDRCRHFVITQDQDGQFGVSGDCQTHGSLTELIEHYKVSPIQPFGEYLTHSCYQVTTGELYDVVNCNPKVKAGVSVQALRTLWDQKNDHHSDPGNNLRIQQQTDSPTVQPPALPLKSKNRKLTGAVSVDAMSLSQGVPPVPKRGIPLSFSLSGSLPETTSHSSDAQTDPNRPETLQGNPNPGPLSDRNSFNSRDTSHPSDFPSPGITYSELTLMESRSQSLPRLNNDVKEDEYSNQLSAPSFTASTSNSPNPPKKVTCHTYSLHDPRDSAARPSGSRSEQQGDDLEMSRSNPLYQTSEGTGEAPERPRDGMYAQVPQRTTSARPPDDTYEQIPGEAAAVQGNTYETLEDMKTKKPKSTWGKSNIKWKKFIPDYKKK